MKRRVLQQMGEQLRVLRGAAPGDRFQELHRQRAGARSRWRQTVSVGGGTALVLAAIVTYPIPGPPSTLMLVTGLALIAQEWVPLARALDRLELRLSARLRWLRARWSRLSAPKKATLGVFSVALIVAFAYGAYDLLIASDGAPRILP